MRATRVLVVACAALLPAGARAQLRPAPAGVALPARAAAAPDPDSAAGFGRRIRIGPLHIPRRDSSWWVPLASAALPGSGQAMLGQDRFIAYLAVEGFAILSYLDQRAEQSRSTAHYQALATNIARAFYPGPYPVGSWAYYESMEHYKESGVFNLTPGFGFTPEVDPATYNGAMWLLARQTYWNDPNVQPAATSAEYSKAFAFYTSRAVQPQYRWSWTGYGFEWDLYVQSIERRNQAARDARFDMGLLIANHLLSMVDSYVTVRLRGGMGAPGSPPALSATIPWAPFGRPSTP